MSPNAVVRTNGPSGVDLHAGYHAWQEPSVTYPSVIWPGGFGKFGRTYTRYAAASAAAGRSGIPDVHEVHPDWQHLEPGDLMRTNRDMGGKPLGWPVVTVDPGRSIVVRSKNLPIGTYAFVLQPIDDTSTRFLVRDRAAWRRREWLFKALTYEPLHAYMETGLLQGTKERAEAGASASPDYRRSPAPHKQAAAAREPQRRSCVAAFAYDCGRAASKARHGPQKSSSTPDAMSQSDQTM